MQANLQSCNKKILAVNTDKINFMSKLSWKSFLHIVISADSIEMTNMKWWLGH